MYYLMEKQHRSKCAIATPMDPIRGNMHCGKKTSSKPESAIDRFLDKPYDQKLGKLLQKNDFGVQPPAFVHEKHAAHYINDNEIRTAPLTKKLFVLSLKSRAGRAAPRSIFL